MGTQQLLEQLPLAVAALVALGWLAQRISAIHRLVSRELERNHGSSMKDDMHGIAVSVGMMQRQVDDLDQRLRTLEARP